MSATTARKAYNTDLTDQEWALVDQELATMHNRMQVVDLTDGIAGPIAGMFMADFGAEVIKIEPAGGDPGREQPGFAMWNRGKKSVIIDAGNADQCRWLGDLIAGADICIVRDEAALQRFNLSSASLAQRNARLLILRMPPYAQTARRAYGRKK